MSTLMAIRQTVTAGNSTGRRDESDRNQSIPRSGKNRSGGRALRSLGRRGSAATGVSRTLRKSEDRFGRALPESRRLRLLEDITHFEAGDSAQGWGLLPAAGVSDVVVAQLPASDGSRKEAEAVRSAT